MDNNYTGLSRIDIFQRDETKRNHQLLSHEEKKEKFLLDDPQVSRRMESFLTLPQDYQLEPCGNIDF